MPAQEDEREIRETEETEGRMKELSYVLSPLHAHAHACKRAREQGREGHKKVRKMGERGKDERNFLLPSPP